MVAQVDEQQAAKVPFAVDPAGQLDGIPDMLRAQLAAGMRPVGMHRGKTPAFPAESGGFGLIERADKRMSPSRLSISALSLILCWAGPDPGDHGFEGR
jgi:hypothetical protein